MIDEEQRKVEVASSQRFLRTGLSPCGQQGTSSAESSCCNAEAPHSYRIYCLTVNN